MEHSRLALFALFASRGFGAAVARHLEVVLSPHEEREFEDGEHKSRPLVSVRGRAMNPRALSQREVLPPRLGQPARTAVHSRFRVLTSLVRPLGPSMVEAKGPQAVSAHGAAAAGCPPG